MNKHDHHHEQQQHRFGGGDPVEPALQRVLVDVVVDARACISRPAACQHVGVGEQQERRRHAEDRVEQEDRHDPRQQDVPETLEPVGAVELGCLEQLGRNRRQGGAVEDDAEAHRVPHGDEDDDRLDVARIVDPRTGQRAEPEVLQRHVEDTVGAEERAKQQPQDHRRQHRREEEDRPEHAGGGNTFVQQEGDEERNAGPQWDAEHEDQLVDGDLAKDVGFEEIAIVAEPDERAVVAGVPVEEGPIDRGAGREQHEHPDEQQHRPNEHRLDRRAAERGEPLAPADLDSTAFRRSPSGAGGFEIHLRTEQLRVGTGHRSVAGG